MRPVMIAVGGDSGTGKSTLCRGLEEIFGHERIATVCLDDYHALDRAQRKATGLTALDPRANNFAAMEEDLSELRDGNAIRKPVYDHSDGTFREPEPFEPREFIIVQGLFPLYTRALRALFDVAVWLRPETELKVTWKIQRDVAHRGYTEAQVREEIQRRQPDVAAHVEPQSRFADLVVEFYRPRDWELHRDHARLCTRLVKADRFDPLDYSEFEREGGPVRQVRIANDRPQTVLELDGHCDDLTAQALQDKIWSHMPKHAHLRTHALGRFEDARGVRTSHTLALAQLLIARRVALAENERDDRYAKAV
jgi:phosphoribulokinase